MNYQLFSPFFTKVIMLLIALLCIVLASFGISAPFFYIVFIGIVFPVAISMRIHRLNETGTALTLTENSHWIVYIHGFPAEEQREVLKNPCFWSTERVKQFFVRGLVGKVILQLASLALLVNEYFRSTPGSGQDLLAAGVLFFILFSISKNFWTMYLLATDKWQCESLTTTSGSLWYQGFLCKGNRRITLFSRLV
ncbi:TPA: hypothetical protein J4P89_003206 [Escherichia coli]|uniref:Uncharacterized protein n=1 Tax=Escherichia coli TaxID=562 RepID=A0A3R0MUS3_ECOLX|nr:hypothetical protein [Escherichia coli]ELJ0538062.1 hypothetical protein [Escherichia coli O36]EEV5546154.1 hypothetical protein [Escherichia coli]EEY5970783.1 hypothetical protein [Escherichia coli]EFC2151668.1 hypothetical protein [Escherichia coli]EFD1932444.1 hypothetical protein [Escherichia coli]